MYKVFIDNYPILFQKGERFATNLPDSFIPALQTADFKTLQTLLVKKGKTETFYIADKNPFAQIRLFFQNFEWIEAAGGRVFNTDTKKSLFIFRNEVWDLPKGKIEKDENPHQAAIREIQEECGLQNISIVQEYAPTFHVYFAYTKFWIKKTHWFGLETTETQTVPQMEEGITKVVWLKENELEIVRENTYSNILEILNG